MKRFNTVLAATVMAAGAILATAIISTAVQGCAHVKDFGNDVKACFGPDVKGDIGDFVKGIGTALVCDLASGGSQLPACTIEGLQTIADEIGPSGKTDVQCVVQKLATDAASMKPGATPEEMVRGERAKLLVKRGGIALWSPDDGRATRGPSLEKLGAPEVSLRGGPETGQQAHNLSSPVQFRAPQLSTPEAVALWGYPGETVAHAENRCDASCGGADAIGSPGGSCLCWRGPHDARGGWVAAR